MLRAELCGNYVLPANGSLAAAGKGTVAFTNRRISNAEAAVDVSLRSFKRAFYMKSAHLIALLLPLSLPMAAYADDTFTVTLEQAISVGGGDGDTFGVERLSRNDNTAVILLRPKGEACTFRFPLSVGRSVQLRTDAADGQSLLCWATLRTIIDDNRAQFAAECTAQPRSDERKCPSESDTAAASEK